MAAPVELPYHYDTRSYQREFWDGLTEIRSTSKGVEVTLLKDRAFLLWHRRSGKDITFVNWMMFLAYYHRVGTYWYMFPFLKQAKQVVWDGMDDMGRRFVDYFPKEIVADTNESELQIRLTNGSVIQLMGADKFTKSSVGPNPVGVGWSEYAISSKMESAWHYVMPMLRQNGGWAVFLTTPRGKNHAYNLWNLARKNSTWFTSIQTVADTKRDSTYDQLNPRFPYLSPVVTEDMMRADALDGMTEEQIQQEYFCSFTAPQSGAYFTAEMQRARQEGRVTRVPWEPTLPVETWWDIGYDDHTAIWFVQKLFREIRLIDFYCNRLQPFEHYAKEVIEKRSKYLYSRHYGPHDLNVKEWFANKKRIEVAADLGIHFSLVEKPFRKEEPIAMVRSSLPRCFFDAEKCEYGINALETYHTEYDADSKVLGTKPEHDWSSNPVDAFMTGIGTDGSALGVGAHGSRRTQTHGTMNSYDMFRRVHHAPFPTQRPL